MAKKDTDPHGIKASMDFVKKVSEITRDDCLEPWAKISMKLAKMGGKAQQIRKKFKNDYDRAGGKL